MSPYDRILDMQVTGKKINKLQFVGSDKLFFDLDGQLKLAQLEFNNTQTFKSLPSDFPSAKMYAISKDGNVFAFLNNNNLDIYDQNQTIVNKIELEIESTQIQAINFGVNNSFYLIDNNSTVTVFLNENCSHGYTNQKGYCLCLRQYAEPSKCQCYPNFVDQEDATCACLTPFVLNGDRCDCVEGWYAY